MQVRYQAALRPDISFTGNLIKTRKTLGVANGTRTHDNRNHNPGLYQLSYSHHENCTATTLSLACPTGIEPVTLSLEG